MNRTDRAARRRGDTLTAAVKAALGRDDIRARARGLAGCCSAGDPAGALAVELLVLAVAADMAARPAGGPVARPERGGDWAQLRAVLESRGLLRPRRDDRPQGRGVAVVDCCPRTGPPVAAPSDQPSSREAARVAIGP